MTNPLDIMGLETVGEGRYRTSGESVGWVSMFGGQIIGHGAAAATASVGADRRLHSLHAYYLRAGAFGKPVDLEVHAERDGGAFSTRRVQGSQDGKSVLTLIASFHTGEEGPEHDLEPMPDVPDPESLKSLKQMSEETGQKSFDMRPLEGLDIRPVESCIPFTREEEAPHGMMWVRMPGSSTDDPAMNRVLIAFLSDLFLISTALQPYRSRAGRNTIVTSLDHSVWFHDDWRADDWMLFTQESPFNRHGRAMCRGAIFGRNGRRVADVMQEGLLRLG